MLNFNLLTSHVSFTRCFITCSRSHSANKGFLMNFAFKVKYNKISCVFSLFHNIECIFCQWIIQGNNSQSNEGQNIKNILKFTSHGDWRSVLVFMIYKRIQISRSTSKLTINCSQFTYHPLFDQL